MYGLTKKDFGQVPQTAWIRIHDIAEHLPGAFIIYRADKEDDELFFANDEFLLCRI